MTFRALTSTRLWARLYLAAGLTISGVTWGATVRDPVGCPVINRIFIFSANSSPPLSIAVVTLFWPAVVIAGFNAGCSRTDPP